MLAGEVVEKDLELGKESDSRDKEVYWQDSDDDGNDTDEEISKEVERMQCPIAGMTRYELRDFIREVVFNTIDRPQA